MMCSENKKKVNGSAVARIAIWAVVLVILTGIFVCVMLMGEEGYMFGINLGGYRYEDADSYQVGNGESSESVTSLDIDWIDGNVNVVPSSGDKVVISEDYKGDEDALRLRWKIEGGKLTIKYQKSGWSALFKKTSGKTLTIEAPQAMLDKMNKVDLSLVSADLLMTGMTALETDIELVSGDVVMNGSFGQLDIDTVSGDVKLEGCIKSAEIDGTSAVIELRLVETPKEIEVDTVSGNVSILLPENVKGFEVDLEAVSGRLYADGFDGLTQIKNQCIYGDGSLKINVEAVSGNLKIGRHVQPE